MREIRWSGKSQNVFAEFRDVETSAIIASLADAACVIMAEGVPLDAAAANKAKMQGITVFKTELPIFEAALAVHERLGV